MSDRHRIATSVPMIRTGATAPRAAGSWMDGTQNRDRRGMVGAMYGGVLSRVAPAGLSRTARLLTADQRRQLYETTPDVRACIDSIARRIATWNWDVKPTVDPRDKTIEVLQKEADKATAWLSAPNEDGETWQEVTTKMVTDLLIDDSGVWELVSDAKGVALKEINVLRGAYVFPVLGLHGRIGAYIQDPSGMGTFNPGQIEQALREVGKSPLSETATLLPTAEPSTEQAGVGPSFVTFKPTDIVQFRLFPNTAWPALGMPLLESLVNECVTVLLAADHLVTAYDADEIPPGVFVLNGLAGTAMKQARLDFEHMRGKDGKIRLIGSEAAGVVDAKWIEMRHNLKDLQLAEILKEVKRTIYRVFGVMPIELGVTEDMPRAVGAEMVDVGRSHLLEPILELIQAKVNARLLPRLVGKQYAGLLKFEFDRRANLTPEEDRAQQEALATAHKRGAITTNEWRAARGLKPYGPEGDIPMIDTSAGPMPLVEAVKLKQPKPADPNANPFGGGGGKGPAGGGTPDPEDDDDPDGGGKGGKGKGDGEDKGGVEDDGKGDGKGDEEAPGEARAIPHAHGAGCDHRAHTPTKDDLPSDWQPEGRFKGKRTVDLGALAYNVSEYVQRVEPLYRDATVDVIAAVKRAHDQNETTADEAERAIRKANDVLDRLASRWSAETLDLYRATVDSSVKQVRKWTGFDVDRADREKRADRYHDAAMGYLTARDGLIGTLRSMVEDAVQRVTAKGTRSLEGTDPDLEAKVAAALAGASEEEAAGVMSATARLAALTPRSTTDEVVGALTQGFEAQVHRTANWSGALVELANETLTDTLAEQARAENADPNRDPGQPPVVWYAEWVDVGDGVTCSVCEFEGAQGFRPASALSFMPGSQATQCKKRCRCVVVMWEKAEVDAGVAVSLAGSSRAP